jgi:hypothetical protein
LGPLAGRGPILAGVRNFLQAGSLPRQYKDLLQRTPSLVPKLCRAALNALITGEIVSNSFG